MRIFAVIIIVLSFFTQCNFKQEVAQWRGPDRNGIYPDTNLLTEWPEGGPKLLWKYDKLGLGYTSAAVTSNKIYITGTTDSLTSLFALNHDGELLWKKPLGNEWLVNFPGARSTPLIYDGRGYLLSGLGVVYCFDADNGDILWTIDLYKQYGGKEVKFGITENFLIEDDKLFCTPGGEDANIIALNRVTGELIWKSKGVGEVSAYCSPVIINHKGVRHLLTITSNSIVSLNPENGELIWSHNLQYPDGIHSNTPVYRDGYIFAMNGWDYGSVMLKLSDDGKSVSEVWRSKLFDLEHGDVVVIGNNIYGADWATKHFSCVDFYTGEVKDSVKTISPSSVIAADGLIYCYTYAGEMALVKPHESGFEVISKFKVDGVKRDHIAIPVIDKGRLYIRYSNTLWVYSILK
ncbi:MAG: PQQ-binding-like beta-propeller repeat protein [Tenuifilaceae bacterium]